MSLLRHFQHAIHLITPNNANLRWLVGHREPAAPVYTALAASSAPLGPTTFQVGKPVSFDLFNYWIGGTPPVSYDIIVGTLPAGLVLDASIGRITGTPTTAAGAAALTIQCTDALTSVSRGWTVTVTA